MKKLAIQTIPLTHQIEVPPIDRRLLSIVLAFAAIVFFALQSATADELRSSQKRLLAYFDSVYDDSEHLLKVEFASPGYHTKVPTGSIVHPTRESFYYAVALLQRGETGDVQRAQKILRRLLPIQQTDANSEYSGVWPWLMEEPLNKMGSVDLSWADFCGSAIAQILVEHRDQIDQDLQRGLENSLRLSADRIRQRDVQPAYTNIAVLGGGVCTMAGEILGDDSLLQYGRQRLSKIAAFTEEQGGFNEYNSPPYSKVVIGECERILQLCEDQTVRGAAESLRATAWKMISKSYHVGTNQIAGPHSRTSRIRLRETTLDFLAERIGKKIPCHPTMSHDKPRGYAIVEPIPCPREFRSRFFDKPAKPNQIQRTFILPRGKTPATVGTTWLSSDACIGSVNQSGFWTQRKPLVAYWATDEDPAIAFRVRCLNGGQDFASMGMKTAQVNNRVLCVIHSMKNRGNWHRSLDRTIDGKHAISDLRMRFELSGVGVTARQTGDREFVLAAGDHRITLKAAKSTFAGGEVTWEIGAADQRVFLDGICHLGDLEHEFDFSKPIDCSLCVAVELHRADVTPTKSMPSIRRKLNRAIGTWRIDKATRMDATAITSFMD